jgi:predicted PurR-regulated permease PerM
MTEKRDEGALARTAESQSRVSTVFFYGSLLFLLYLTYLILVPFAAPILWAAVLGVLFYPAYRRLVRALRGRTALAAFLLTTAVILAVVVPAIYFALVLAREAAGFYQVVQRLYQQQGLEGIVGHPAVTAALALWERLSLPFKRLGFDFRGLMLAGVNAVSSFIVDNLKEIAKNLLTFSIDFLLTAFTLFFLFRDGAAIVSGVQSLVPLERRRTEALLVRLYDAVSAVVRGTLVTAVAQGTLGGLGYWVLGVPFPVFLGLATALLSLLPVGGSALVWVPASIYLILKGSWIRGLLLLAWSVLIVSTADNILKPLLMTGGTKLPTLFLFFGMLGGLQVFGVLGFILGPVLLVTLAAFLEMYRETSLPAPDRPAGT